MAKQDLKLDGVNPPALGRVKIVLGVSGGIAAYKAIDLASKLTAAGAEVRSVLTESTLNLVGAKSFEAVTGGPAHTRRWEQQEFKIGHVNLADWADVIIIAPAMNDKMWANPAVQENIKFAERIGVKMIGPREGRLACGTEGLGRMAEPQEILEAVEKIAAGIKRK